MAERSSLTSENVEAIVMASGWGSEGRQLIPQAKFDPTKKYPAKV